MDDREQLDQLLDTALGSYSEPREGLENRVLAALDAERTRSMTEPKRRWFAWAIATPAMAVVLLLVFTMWVMPKHAGPPSKPGTSASVMPHATTVSRLPELHTAPVLKQRVSAHRAVEHRAPMPQRLPKLDIFPTPQPLTPSERALLEYAANAPPEERRALVESQQKQDQPIHIAAIEITPIESSTSHGN